MNWTVALGLGMWSAACFQDLEIPWPVTSWGVLGLLHVLVPLAEWCRLAPFVLLGWGFVTCEHAQRQVWVRHAMGVSALIGAWVTLETRGTSCKGSPHHRLWHVSARSPTWLMEDGWRGEVWTSSSRDSVKAAHLANHLGLAHVAWNTSWDGPNATKSQPPVEVWDFGQNPGATCQATLERKISSVSGAE